MDSIGLSKLKSGDFNNMSQVTQPDGSVQVTMTKRGDPHRYCMLVVDLYKPTERVLQEWIEGK
jgi:hypothetical protein